MSKITVYSTTTCPYCHMLKEYLTSKHIDFNDVVLDQQPEKREDFIDTCGSMAVPCTHIETDDGKSEVIVGFDQSKINQVLGISG